MVRKLLHITIALVGAMFGLYVGSFAVNGFLSELGSNVYVKMGIVGVASERIVISIISMEPSLQCPKPDDILRVYENF